MRFCLLGCAAAVVLSGCVAPEPSAGPAKGHDPHDVQATAPGAATCPETTAAENAAGVAATNRVRRAKGLAPLTPDPVLALAAARHACDMAQRGRMTHAGTSTKGPAMRVKALGYRPALTAENIAAGPFSLDRVLGEWNRSPGHLANILIPQTRQYGIGHAVAADGKTVFWAAVYGAPR